jgi:hypothetical protein
VLTGAIADRVDLLVVNRFGRAESLGRGMLGTFAAAMEAQMPVLTAVRPPYEQAWTQFHGSSAEVLPATSEAVVRWGLASIPSVEQGAAHAAQS